MNAIRDPRSCRGDRGGPPALPQRDELDRARVLYAAGRDAAADRIAASVVASLPPAAAPQLTAEALKLRGDVAGRSSRTEEAMRLLFDALAAAERSHDDRRVVEVWVAVLGVAGPVAQNFDLATMAARAATAALGRIDADPSIRSDFGMSYGETLLAEGKLAPAREQLRDALTIADTDPAARGRAALLRNALCELELEDRRFAAAHEVCKPGSHRPKRCSVPII